MVFQWNMRQVGYADLEGRSGFKMAIKEKDGRFYLYVAPLWEPGLTILDITDPTSPKQVRWIDGPASTWTLQVQVAGERMITNLEHVPAGWGQEGEPGTAGMTIWDVSDPEDPTVLGIWRTEARGTHRNFYDGGRYVHAAASLPGFQGNIYAAIDIADPENPQLVGKWWYPGQDIGGAGGLRAGGHEAFETQRAYSGSGIFLHGGAYRSGNRVYCPWANAGLVVLDIDDITQPRLVSNLLVHPPLGNSMAVHTAVPLPERNLVLINDEALKERRGDPPNFAAVVDISDESNPVLISLFPVPQPPDGAPADYFSRGGRFGPHNQHQPQGQSCLAPVDGLVYLTYFNAGLQLFDITDPLSPKIVGFWIPDEPSARRGPHPSVLVTQVEDVIVDRRGYIYVSEKNSGITVLTRD